jgi:hypothetical protein
MVTPAAGAVHYVRVRPGRDADRAVRRMRAPSDAAKELMANGGIVPGSLMAAVVPETTTPVAPVVDPATAGVAPAPTVTPTPIVTPAPTPPAATTQTDPATGGTATPAPTAAPVG